MYCYDYGISLYFFMSWSEQNSRAVVGLMDRVLDLKPEANGRLWVRIPAPTGSPRLLPGRCTVGCPLLQVCTLGWVKCREHISLLIILCIIVYVTNKAHPSLICIVLNSWRLLAFPTTNEQRKLRLWKVSLYTPLWWNTKRQEGAQTRSIAFLLVKTSCQNCQAIVTHDS